MTRKFSDFVLKSTFPEEETVIAFNYRKYSWSIFNNKDEFVTEVPVDYLWYSEVKVLISGDEQAVKYILRTIVKRLRKQANNIISILH